VRSYSNVASRTFQTETGEENAAKETPKKKTEEEVDKTNDNKRMDDSEDREGSKADISADFESESDVDNEDDVMEDGKEVRGEKRIINGNSSLVEDDSFREVFPPQKRRGSWSSRGSPAKKGDVPPITTQNTFIVLDGLTPIDTPDSV
jgi:hypothetical protein